MNLTIRRRETLIVVGESGSGKSMTAKAVLGLLPRGASATGTVQFEGENLLQLNDRQMRRHRGSGLSTVFQDPARALNPTMRIGRQVAEAVHDHFGLDRKASMARAIELLDLVGIPFAHERAREFPYQLSGGLRQRAMIAIAISCNPAVIIADEPTSALDVTIQAQIMDLLRRLQDEFDMGILLITHDMGLAFSYGDEVAVMYGGRIVEQARTLELQRKVRMPYTRGLLDSVPRLNDTPHSVFKALTGRPTEPSAIGTGCSFAPRCSYRQSNCDTELPPTTHDGDHSFACWYPL
jgi:oligopeptide/dipeptide ABC transporter ATP-binding protein